MDDEGIANQGVFVVVVAAVLLLELQLKNGMRNTNMAVDHDIIIHVTRRKRIVLSFFAGINKQETAMNFNDRRR
jgi:hypothetical protein